jgi:hypothetical protein
MDIDFSNQNIAIQIGDVLSIVLHSETGLSQSYNVSGNGSKYGGGYDGGNWFLRLDYGGNANIWYESSPDLGMALFFKTYVEPSAVPLPSTVLLLGSGLVRLACYRRRKSATSS